MATIKLTREGQDGTIRLLTDSSIDFNRYFHQENVDSVLNQPSGEKIIGPQIIPAYLEVDKKESEIGPVHFKGEVLILAAMIGKDDLGNPTKIMVEEGNLLAVSCRPFLIIFPLMELRMVTE